MDFFAVLCNMLIYVFKKTTATFTPPHPIHSSSGINRFSVCNINYCRFSFPNIGVVTYSLNRTPHPKAPITLQKYSFPVNKSKGLLYLLPTINFYCFCNKYSRSTSSSFINIFSKFSTRSIHFTQTIQNLIRTFIKMLRNIIL